MRVTVFTDAQGGQVSFAPHQRLALERGGVWWDYGYTVKATEEGEPTFTDAEIAVKLCAYRGLTRIARPDPRFTVPNHPYNLHNRFGTDTPCVSFEAALDCARDIGCDVVQVPAADMERWFDQYAAERGITLLVV